MQVVLVYLQPFWHNSLLIGDFAAQIDSDRRGQNVAVRPHGTAKETTKTVRDWPVYVSTMDWRLEIHSSSTKISTRKPGYLSPDSNKRNEIDYICINNRWGSSLSDVQVFRGADVSTDHYLLVGKIRLKLKRSAKKKISSICSGKAERPTNITRIWVGALKPFHSTSAKPVHGKEMGTLQHQCQDQCRNCYWTQTRHEQKALDIRQNLEPYRWQKGGKEDKKKNEGHGNYPALSTAANSRCTRKQNM